MATKVDAATGNPFIVDTADSTAVAVGQFTVRAVRWVGASTNAHTAVITDAGGRVKWASQAATATLGTPEESVLGFSSNGLMVPTLASGKLYVYF